MVVLVNRNSASASEIVTGSLQDHDRALIVGETTFGKALVQSVYTISEQAGLALTTGRYYTPSGRMIQRPWDGTFDEYLTYTLRDQKAEREHSAAAAEIHRRGTRRSTAAAASSPTSSWSAPVEGFNPTRFGRSLFARQAFANFADQFTRRRGHAAERRRTRTRSRSRKGFEVTDAMVADFRASLRPQKVKIDEEAFAKDDTFIRAMIHFEIESALFGMDEAQTQPDREGSAGAVRAGAVCRSRDA